MIPQYQFCIFEPFRRAANFSFKKFPHPKIIEDRPKPGILKNVVFSSHSAISNFNFRAVLPLGQKSRFSLADRLSPRFFKNVVFSSHFAISILHFRAVSPRGQKSAPRTLTRNFSFSFFFVNIRKSFFATSKPFLKSRLNFLFPHLKFKMTKGILIMNQFQLPENRMT